jgi:hypothetical protein
VSVGGFIKDTGSTLVALAGLGVAYVNSRQPGREARHHARVETLYQDMLDTLQHRLNVVMKQAGIGEIGSLPMRDPEAYQVTRARIRLYASGPVTESWDKVHLQLTALELGQAQSQLKLTMLHMNSVEAAIGELAELMRRDLGVPDMPLRTRTWSWVRRGWYFVSFGQRRAIKAMRSRQSENQE